MSAVTAAGKQCRGPHRRFELLRGAGKILAAAEALVARTEAVSLPPERLGRWSALLSALDFAHWAGNTAPGNGMGLKLALAELENRLAAFSGRPLPHRDGLPGLMALAENPEAGVSVEFSRGNGNSWPRLATVALNCGYLPLTDATAEEYASEEDAEQALNLFKRYLEEGVEQEIAPGVPAVTGYGFEYVAVPASDYNPARMVQVIDRMLPTTIRLQPLNFWCRPPVEALVIGTGVPKETEQKLRSEAERHGIPILTAAEAEPLALYAVAGTGGHRKKGGYDFPIMVIEQYMTVFRRGRIVYRAGGPSVAATRKFSGLLAAGKPVAPADAERIRRDVAAVVAAQYRNLPDSPAATLRAGDTHTHTCFSDGTGTPGGLALEALAHGLDFLVISDHNNIAGAHEGIRRMAELGIDFPITVGEEITTDRFHLNVFGLSENIPDHLGFTEMIAQAHRQNAVIQWNHPGTYGRELDRFLTDCSGSELDGWEHYPEHYPEWRRNRTLPVLTGGTDTHYGIFGFLGRTVVRSQDRHADLPELIRRRQAAMVNCRLPDYVYGDETMCRAVAAALQDGDLLRRETLQRRQKAFRTASQ